MRTKMKFMIEVIPMYVIVCASPKMSLQNIIVSNFENVRVSKKMQYQNLKNFNFV